MKQKDKSAFSLVIAMGLSILMILLVLFILEYIIPYSKNVKGIENSTNAFYQAESAIENGLYHFKKRTNIITEDSEIFPTSATGSMYDTFSSGEDIPAIIDGVQEGNSEYDTTFNRIAIGKPLQLQIGGNLGLNFLSSTFYFNLPDLNDSGAETLSGNLVNLPVINWQLSSDGDTLNASGSWITSNQVNGSSAIGLNGLAGNDLDGNPETLGGYYGANCGGTSKCILKFSIINTLELTTGESVPYLEYKIHFNNSVPLRFSRIKAKGKSYGFQKSLEVRIPQQTTNEAFDFTVFQ